MDFVTFLQSTVIGICILIGLVVVLVAAKKKDHVPDYRTFFVMGIVWFVLGVPLQSSGLWILGLVFLVLGISNKDAWKTNKKSVSHTKSEKKIAGLVALVTVLMLMMGAVTFFAMAM